MKNRPKVHCSNSKARRCGGEEEFNLPAVRIAPDRNDSALLIGPCPVRKQVIHGTPGPPALVEEICILGKATDIDDVKVAERSSTPGLLLQGM
jgi:hypothetical protein